MGNYLTQSLLNRKPHFTIAARLQHHAYCEPQYVIFPFVVVVANFGIDIKTVKVNGTQTFNFNSLFYN